MRFEFYLAFVSGELHNKASKVASLWNGAEFGSAATTGIGGRKIDCQILELNGVEIAANEWKRQETSLGLILA